VRLALGASPKDIVRLVFKQAAVWVAVGLVVGTLAVFCLLGDAPVLEDASPFAIGEVALGAAVIFCAALLAAWLPAKRAMQVNPVEALRAE